MTTRTLVRGFTALALLLVGLTLIAPEATANDQPRPFRGNAEGLVTGLIEPSEDCPFGGFTAFWTGNATHLGRFTRQEVLCYTNAELTEFEGEIVFTAANGDTLSLKFSGSFEPGPGGTLLAEGPYEFTGGTGRFANASGSAGYQAVAFPIGDQVLAVVEFDGFICY
ncbi:hypothetical protein [Tautonia marina]|uniref:hypothetical protein n=1 Tax=Tautonia marina TaxID=2653855 RepID=UPI0012611FFE|nr:hypothetical protein [Tautonia marina]